jgi:hypothetical protein
VHISYYEPLHQQMKERMDSEEGIDGGDKVDNNGG